MRILISAGEASSDAHGAELLRALRAQVPAGTVVEAFGVGGPKLQSQGLLALVDAKELLVMGFSEIVGRLPRILRALRTLEDAARSRKPDIAVVIDYPDFHFRLARKLKLAGVPVVYYIPPKIWVWRKGRIRLLRELFTQILCILPFEEAIYRKARVPVTYIGNPLVDELPMELTRAEARKRLGLPMDAEVLVLMPGSRPSELKRHFEAMLDAACAAAQRLGTKFTVCVPLPAVVEPMDVEARLQTWVRKRGVALKDLPIELKISYGNSPETLIAADAGLIKSGTSTLEAGLLGCPHVVVYKPSLLSELIFKHLIRYRGPVGLVNLVAGWQPGQPYLAEEVLMDRFTVPRLTDEIVDLLRNEKRRSALTAGFKALRGKVMAEAGSGPSGPSARAAFEILRLIGPPR